MRRLLLAIALATTGCGKTSETRVATWPEVQLDLAFLVLLHPDNRLERIEGPYFDVADAPPVRFPVSEDTRLQLVGWTREAIAELQPYADLERLAEAELRAAANKDCDAQSFDGPLSFAGIEASATQLELDPTTRTFVQVSNRDVLEELELTLPALSTGNLPGEIDRLSGYSSSDALVFTDGSVVGGVTHRYIDDDAELFYRFNLLHPIDRDHSIVLSARYAFFLERGDAQPPRAFFDILSSAELRALFAAPYISGSTADPAGGALYILIAENGAADRSAIVRLPYNDGAFGESEVVRIFDGQDLTFLSEKNGLFVVVRGEREVGTSTSVAGTYTFGDIGIDIRRLRLTGDPQQPLVAAASNGSVRLGNIERMEEIDLRLPDFASLSDMQTEIYGGTLHLWISDNMGFFWLRRSNVWEAVVLPTPPPATADCVRVSGDEPCGLPLLTDIDSFDVVRDGPKVTLYFVPGPCAGLMRAELGSDRAQFFKPTNGIAYDTDYNISGVGELGGTVYGIGKRAVLTTYEHSPR